jgi:hypothetical protein
MFISWLKPHRPDISHGDVSFLVRLRADTSVIGAELPTHNVRASVAIEGKADQLFALARGRAFRRIAGNVRTHVLPYVRRRRAQC